MDTVPRSNETTSLAEAEKQRERVLEADMIAEADAEIETGAVVDEIDADAWIDSLGTDRELPLPESRR